MTKKVLVIASAGGHLTQAMCATSSCSEIVLVSNKINLKDDRIKKAYKILDTQHNPLIHAINIFFALYVILRERPKAIFSTGGPIVLPFALLSRLFRIKFIFLDTLSRVTELSNTGKLIKRHHLYTQFFSQWQDIAKQQQVKYIGKCFDILGENNPPISPNSQETQNTSPLILVTLGTNQYPFNRVLEAISKMDLYKDQRVEWIIQAGSSDVITPPSNGKIVSLVERSQMEEYVKRASLVISHCGIGSINQMLSYKKQVFFVPRVAHLGEFSDDHQLQIASQLTNPNFTVINHDNNDFPEISYEDLKKVTLIKEPIDITNHEFSDEIFHTLFD